jgi:hypothetical protein
MDHLNTGHVQYSYGYCTQEFPSVSNVNQDWSISPGAMVALSIIGCSKVTSAYGKTCLKMLVIVRQWNCETVNKYQKKRELKLNRLSKLTFIELGAAHNILNVESCTIFIIFIIGN